MLLLLPFSECEIKSLISNYSFGCAGVWKGNSCVFVSCSCHRGRLQQWNRGGDLRLWERRRSLALALCPRGEQRGLLAAVPSVREEAAHGLHGRADLQHGEGLQEKRLSGNARQGRAVQEAQSVRQTGKSLEYLFAWSSLISKACLHPVGRCSVMDFYANFQIRNWFQNRRMKLKRTMQDALAHACQASAVPQLLHYPELQAYRPGPYPRFTPAAAVAAPEGPAAASFIHPHGLQYSPAMPSVPALSLDSYYQYSSIPGVVLPPATTPLMGSYPAYPQYYWRAWNTWNTTLTGCCAIFEI